MFNEQYLFTIHVIPTLPQMSVPPPMLAVPPPSIQSVEQLTTVNPSLVQQTNIVTQNTPTIVTTTPVQTVASHSQPQIIQQQILSGNMAIQQPVQTSSIFRYIPTRNLR